MLFGKNLISVLQTKLISSSHVPQAIEITGRGLHYQSDEVMEATHAKFDTFWRRYKVIDVESEIPGERLLECVLDF